MPAIRARNQAFKAIAIILLSVVCSNSLAAANDDPSVQAKRARGGGGLRVGTWQVVGLDEPGAPSSTESVAAEGWYQKGFDLHIALESTMGFWQRTQTVTEVGSVAGTGTERKIQSYLVPTMSTLKLYPATRPSSPLEPYLAAGVGIVLGIDHQDVSTTDPIVAPGTTNTFHTGLGIQTGAGLEWNSPSAFGLTVGGRYQWASFAEDVGGKALYRGPAYFGGVTYRFQYQ
jgi:opacity protein-like surface antigen